jgi:IS5 family transposase
MPTKQTNTTQNSVDGYKATVLEYLRENGSVASKTELRQNLNIPDWYITQISSIDIFYTSLNHNGSYVASKYLIGHRSDHENFWRPEVDDGCAVFHREESTKATLKTLVFKRQSGLTPAEATELLERDCYQPLADLAADGEIGRVELDSDDTIVYVHRWPSRREDQLAERRTDHRVELDEPDTPDDTYLFRETLLHVFVEASRDSVTSAPNERVAACLLRQFEGDSFAALELRLRRNHSLQDVLGYATPADVDDATTLWRAFNDLTKEELKDCLHTLVSEVLAKTETDHAGRFLVVDGTHVEAWANTRNWIENGDVEGAAWGKHEGSFYGYQVMLLVDPAMELPVAIMVRPGNEAEKTLFAPLVEDFTDRYDTDEFDCEAVFADAEYDTKEARKEAEEVLEAPLATGINPRRSKPLKALKEEIKDVFQEHGNEIETPYDALERLPQTLLSDYGVELGSIKESYLYRAIKERMNRHLRSSVERVIGRLKEFTGMSSVRARKESTAHTHILLSAIALATVAVTAHRVGKPSLMRSPSRIM